MDLDARFNILNYLCLKIKAAKACKYAVKHDNIIFLTRFSLMLVLFMSVTLLPMDMSMPIMIMLIFIVYLIMIMLTMRMFTILSMFMTGCVPFFLKLLLLFGEIMLNFNRVFIQIP